MAPVLLFLLLVGLLYLPPVQKMAVDMVAGYASKNLNMRITVGHVQMAFPLDLSIDDFRVINHGDTIADVRHLVVDVQLLPLLDKKVIVNELEIEDTRLNTNGFIDAVQVKGDFRRLALKSRGINLDHQTVDVSGARLEDARLDILMRDSVPEDTTQAKTLWKIAADSLTILRSDVAVHMPADTIDISVGMGRLVARQIVADLGAPVYTIGSLDWDDGRLAYNDIDMPRLGLHTGPLAMQGDSIRVPSLHLRTPDSHLSLSLDLPLSFADSIRPGSLQLAVDADLSRQDLQPFMAALPRDVRERWPHYPLAVKGQVSGNLQMMDFKNLDVSLPTAISARADGFVANLSEPRRLRADVTFRAQTQDLGFLMAAQPRDVQRNYRIPPMTAEGRVRVSGAQYIADITASEGQGTIHVDGTLNADLMRYDATVAIDRMNLHHFMPHDSIYTLTADITARGQGTDFFSPRTMLQADGHISHLDYGRWNQIGRAHV